MTLYVVQASGADPKALEKARFVRQGFSKPALVFGPFWLLYSRLWLPLLIWIGLEVFYLFVVASHVPPAISLAVDVLAHLYLGLEGNRLRLKRDTAVNDLVEARDRDEAETIFFRRHMPETARA